VRDDYEKFKAVGADVVGITLGTPEETAAFRAKLSVPFLLSADPEQTAYGAFGLDKGSVSQVMGPRTWLPLMRGMVRGGQGKPTGDIWQMPGTFVVDRQGIVRMAHYPEIQTDRATNKELIAVLSSLD